MQTLRHDKYALANNAYKNIKSTQKHFQQQLQERDDYEQALQGRYIPYQYQNKHSHQTLHYEHPPHKNDTILPSQCQKKGKMHVLYELATSNAANSNNIRK